MGLTTGPPQVVRAAERPQVTQAVVVALADVVTVRSWRRAPLPVFYPGTAVTVTLEAGPAQALPVNG